MGRSRLTMFFPVLGGIDSHVCGKGFAEMGLVVEPAFQSDCSNRGIGLHELSARVLKSDPE